MINPTVNNLKRFFLDQNIPEDEALSQAINLFNFLYRDELERDERRGEGETHYFG